MGLLKTSVDRQYS